MPYKFIDGRRHRFSKAKCRVTNWPKHNAALVRRGSLTVWFTEESVAAWHAPATRGQGGQPIYSAITGAWSNPQCIATRPLSADGFTSGLCAISDVLNRMTTLGMPATVRIR
jgi:hypothetical protein